MNTEVIIESGTGGEQPAAGAGLYQQLPHEDYILAVYNALAGLGLRLGEDAQTSSPDGQQLDGWISFRPDVIDRTSWPAGVYLGWDQHAGWSLCDEGTRSLYPLELEVYASPTSVAARTRTRLSDEPDAPADQAWDGAEALKAAVAVWGGPDMDERERDYIERYDLSAADIGAPTIPDTYTDYDDVNPVCGCHRSAKCMGCGVCTTCDACYCDED